MMATVRVKFSCGCGWSSPDVEEAIKHCDHFKHTVPVLGYIMPENGRKEKGTTITIQESEER